MYYGNIICVYVSTESYYCALVTPSCFRCSFFFFFFYDLLRVISTENVLQMWCILLYIPKNIHKTKTVHVTIFEKYSHTLIKHGIQQHDCIFLEIEHNFTWTCERQKVEQIRFWSILNNGNERYINECLERKIICYAHCNEPSNNTNQTYVWHICQIYVFAHFKKNNKIID